jgi:hypothetical protein
MGWLNKYFAYRWVSSGSGAGGGGGLALFLLIVGGFIGVLFVFGYVLNAILAFLYGTSRSILGVAPLVTVPIAGILVARTIAAMPAYEPEAAVEILRGEKEDSTFLFYLKGALIFGFIIIAGWAFFDGVISDPYGPIEAGIAMYFLYKIVHLPYRYTRLLRHAPQGTRLMTVCLFPTVTGMLWGIYGFDSGFSPGGLLSSAATYSILIGILVPYVLPLALIKLRAEPHILPQSMLQKSATND